MSSKPKNHPQEEILDEIPEGEADPFDFDSLEESEVADDDVEEAVEEQATSSADPFDFGSGLDGDLEDGLDAEEENTPKAPPPPPPPPQAKAPRKAPAQSPASTPKAKSRPQSAPLSSSAPTPSQVGGEALAQEAPLQVAAILGKKTLTVGELVNLKKGEVLEFNRFPNEAVDLMAHGKLMAKGELVEVDGKLGVRIIKIF